MTRDQINARMEVYEDILGHIPLAFDPLANDATEIEQSRIVATLLRKQSERWYEREMKKLDRLERRS